MARDLSKAKRNIGSVFPENVIDAGSGIGRVEPLLTASRFKSRHFFGIPLISPMTKEKISNADLRDYIKRAVAQVELEAKVEIAPVVRRERLPFDPNMYHQHIYLEIGHKPIQKVIRLAICSAAYNNTLQQDEQYPSGAEIFRIPEEWVEMANSHRGIINVNPINPAFSAIGTTTAVAASGATILQFIGSQGWVPAYWTVEATFGFCSEDGQVPIVINEAVGMKAAMLLIMNMMVLFRNTSHSLGIDGMSQSVADQMWQLLKTKYDTLQPEYLKLIKRLKVLTGNTMFSSNV